MQQSNCSDTYATFLLLHTNEAVPYLDLAPSLTNLTNCSSTVSSLLVYPQTVHRNLHFGEGKVITLKKGFIFNDRENTKCQERQIETVVGKEVKRSLGESSSPSGTSRVRRQMSFLEIAVLWWGQPRVIGHGMLPQMCAPAGAALGCSHKCVLPQEQQVQ